MAKNEKRILVYPFQDTDNLGWFEQNLRDAAGNDLLTEEELNTCLTKGCISIETLRNIHDRIFSNVLRNRLSAMAWWSKIKKTLDFSEESWSKYFKTE